MARPKKLNADYFSHDNDMRNDERILSVRRKFWHTWYSVWNMLLEKLCKSDYFVIKYNDMNIEFLSWDFQIDPIELKDIINYFIMIWLLQQKDNEIFCQKLIDRFEWLISKRTRDRGSLSPAKTPNKQIIASEKPQSKVKESKVKESKVNNNISLGDFIPKWNAVEKIWDKKWFMKCKWETKDLKVAWDKVIKQYSKEEIELGVRNYILDIKNRKEDIKWYWLHRFSLYEFITQKNWLKLYINK
jgi:hypothetical protein